MLWIDSIPGIDRRRLPVVCLALAICAFFTIDASDAATNETKDSWTGFSTSCTSEDSKNVSVSCHGVRIVRKIVQQFLETTSKERDIELFDGVSLVEAPGNGSSRKARVLKGFGGLGPFFQFLEGRELRIKLPSLLPSNFETALKESLPSESEARQKRGGGGGGYGGGGGGGGYGGGGGGGKGGKKGGGGGYMILALMMGKMMAAMGMGAVGLLAMKALMVSAMALMLSLIVAVKKLAGGGDDHGGHHVVYAQEVGHHHRKKRSIEDVDSTLLPYRGYAHLYANSGAS
ncbi:heterogeneous nuclear ribonucleoprotein A0-like [Pogonomyrmex barbatus]|uniref:Heterogeneous nuclear ribonucleoprotein A0-like n=1 Tax=Pogonomyrmex barbatus TaxID=144034 RepID=A0A6I9WQN8_9HYME|nr:heterogeneous nuclear ribonucleoprotein A0-like [Pogonomyrmex barbatus]